MAETSVLLAAAAAIITHVAVRYAATRRRTVLLAVAALTFALALYVGRALGGFWAGAYTLMSVYFLTCIATPWVEYLLRQRHVG